MPHLKPSFFEVHSSEHLMKTDAMRHIFSAPPVMLTSYITPKLKAVGESSYVDELYAVNAAAQDDVSELQKKSDRLTHLLQVMPAGVIVLDQKGIVKQANQQAVALLGEPLERELWREIITRSFKPQADDGHEVSLRDGRKVKLSITPLVEEKGQLIVLTDLTETRELQSRVGHLQRLSSLGKMVASLAHQVRTPLSSAMLYAANLKSLNLNNDTASRFATKLMSRLQDLESQVNDMLLFAKSGDQQIVSPMSVNDLLSSCAQSVDGKLNQHQVSIEVQVLTHDVDIMGNHTALAGAIANLLTNAIEISPLNANVQLSARFEAKSLTANEPDGEVVIEVRDQGPGIDTAQLDKIFEPFYTTKSQGTGLGLAVVKSVLKSHQGEIQANNNEQCGANFVLRIPALPQKISHSHPLSGAPLKEKALFGGMPEGVLS